MIDNESLDTTAIKWERQFWFNFLSKFHIPSRLWINAYQRGGNLNRWIIHLIKFPPTYLSDICIYSQATRNVSFWQEIKSKLKVEQLGPLPQKLQRECKRSQIGWNFLQNSSKFVEMPFLKEEPHFMVEWFWIDESLMDHWAISFSQQIFRNGILQTKCRLHVYVRERGQFWMFQNCLNWNCSTVACSNLASQLNVMMITTMSSIIKPYLKNTN